MSEGNRQKNRLPVCQKQEKELPIPVQPPVHFFMGGCREVNLLLRKTEPFAIMTYCDLIVFLYRKGLEITDMKNCDISEKSV